MLLTTGRQAQGLDVKPLSEVIKPIQDMGTRTYVIAIGSEPNTRELKSLVGKTQDIFRVLVDIMEREVPRVIDHIRKGTNITAVNPLCCIRICFFVYLCLFHLFLRSIVFFSSTFQREMVIETLTHASHLPRSIPRCHRDGRWQIFCVIKLHHC